MRTAEAVKVITCTAEELSMLIREAVKAELAATARPKPDHAYDTAEAAEYLRMSPNALRHHIRAGNIKPDVFGKRGRTASHRFTRATLDAFIDEGAMTNGRQGKGR
jgi:hypothetical protein